MIVRLGAHGATSAVGTLRLEQQMRARRALRVQLWRLLRLWRPRYAASAAGEILIALLSTLHVGAPASRETHSVKSATLPSRPSTICESSMRCPERSVNEKPFGEATTLVVRWRNSTHHSAYTDAGEPAETSFDCRPI